MLRVLITGNKGFLGKRLHDRIPEALGIDLKDGQDLLTCELPKDIDLIYHLAAQAFVEPSWANPIHTLMNLQITARLVHKYPNARIIFANSSASWNFSPYGFSKVASGNYLKAFHQDYINITLPNLYGEGSGRVIDIFKGKEEVTIYGDGLQIRDYVHVDDIVEGLLKAPGWPTGDYSMGSGIGTRVLDLAKGKKIVYAPARREDREVIVPNTCPDWRPLINLKDYE